MDPRLTLGLLNPTTSLVFAAVCFAFWWYQRKTYFAVLAAVYACLAINFTIPMPMLRWPWHPEITQFIAQALGLLNLIGLCYAMCLRMEVRFPAAAIVALGALEMAAYLWFALGQPNFVARQYSTGTGNALILLVTAYALRKSPRHYADKILIGLLVWYAFVYFGRPFFLLPIGQPLVPANFQNYWMVYHLSHLLTNIAIVTTLIASVVMDSTSQLRDASVTDPLSGLLNRRGFEAEAARAMEHARANGLPLSLIMCDLDHFKAINDNYGHSTGDRIIASFARVIKELVGSNHVVGRVGGEEFAVLVKGGDASTAEMIAQGARVALATLRAKRRS